jgi:hypothetical protein
MARRKPEMSKLPTATSLAPDDEIDPTTHAEVVLEAPLPLPDVEAKPAPTLITEQEVVFGTAAVVRPSTRWWTQAARVIAAPTLMSVTTAADPRPKRRHYHSRSVFLEDSRMAREMLRL